MVFIQWNIIHQIKSNEVLYLWLIHVVVWQKPTQYCKAIILQSIINFLEKKNLKKEKWIIKHTYTKSNEVLIYAPYR